jgi:hypothetical protein
MKLNQKAYEHAHRLIKDGKFVGDDRDDWSEHQPSAAEENEFIERHGWGEYSKWHLGLDEEYDEETKSRYKFPYGEGPPLRPAGRGVARPVQVLRHRARSRPLVRNGGIARQSLIQGEVQYRHTQHADRPRPRDSTHSRFGVSWPIRVDC